MSKIKLIFSVFDTPPLDWDQFVKENHGFYVQSSKWPEVFSKNHLGEGRYIRAYKGKKLVMQLLVWDSILGGTLLLERVPEPIIKLLLKIPFLRSYSFHMGPVIDETKISNKEKVEFISQLINYIVELSRKEGKNIGPGALLAFSKKDQANDLKKRFRRKLSIKSIATVRTQISGDLEYMSRVIEYSRRKNINRAERMGVVVKEVGIEKIEYYWKFLHESWSEYGLSVPSVKYYRNFPLDATRIFFSYYKKKLIAGNGVLVFGDTCMEFSIFITNYEKEAKTRGGDLIKWKLIEYCLSNNIKYWDLNMLDLAESEEKTKKINFYKLEWGGEIVYGVEIFKLNYLMDRVQKIKWRFIGK